MKRFLTISLILFCFTQSVNAQPGTEIYLFDLKLKKDKISISNPVRVTNHPGYDSQPFFHPDKSILYYASADTSGRTDILTYNYQTKESKRFTNTNEREYSPTVTPDKKFVSCIIQRDDGKQDLGKYPIDGGKASIIIDDLTIGYHGWVDHNNVVVFVLGEPQTLRLWNTEAKKDFWLADSIGRSIHLIPKTKNISFVDKSNPNQWLIKRIKNIDTIDVLIETLPNREDLAWTNDRRIVMSDGEKLFYSNPDKGKEWKLIEVNSGTFQLKGISRLSINASGDKMAIVISE
jgi:dipeptidyl aminopeptidase/acylaminoacyl peptidase